jgi:hypothetical protein
MVSSGDVTKEGFYLTEYTELRLKTVKARHIKNKFNLIYGIPLNTVIIIRLMIRRIKAF